MYQAGMKPIRVLISCEFSGVVRRAFRERGHDAWSCDLLPAEDDSAFHYMQDVESLLGPDWDLMIAFPPCTHLAVSGARWFPAKRADGSQQSAIQFAEMLWSAPIGKICLENPIGILSTQSKLGPERWKERSRTLSGVANAMADQWGHD